MKLLLLPPGSAFPTWPGEPQYIPILAQTDISASVPRDLVLSSIAEELLSEPALSGIRERYATVLPWYFVLLGPDPGSSTYIDLNRLERVSKWIDDEGLYHYEPNCASSSSVSVRTLETARNDGLIRRDPSFIYLIPAQGFGATGTFELLFESELFWLGLGLLVSEVRIGVPVLLKRNQVLHRARQVCDSFRSRGIYSVDTLRVWVNTRDSWTTHLGCKQLGIDPEMMEAIFNALGYHKRHEDQLWLLGETEEYRKRRQAWIDAEPELRRVSFEQSAAENLT